jgi:cyclic pyranopterin phosphate synthase
MKTLSHTDKEGRARMVDVGGKETQKRKAIAAGFIQLQPETVQLVLENQIKKGDVITVAEIAGIQAAKRTYELIPLCHSLSLTKVLVNCSLNENGVEVTSEVRCNGQTGVEMEALTAVSTALLTIYDMCKAVDKEMVIENIRLIEKTKE